MRSMQFKTTIGSGGIPTPQRMDVPPGVGRGGNVITYRVTDIPEGVEMAAVRNLLAQTAVHGVYVVPYGQLGPGRIVTSQTVSAVASKEITMRFLVRLMPFTSGRNHDPTYSVVEATSARAAVAAHIGSDCTVSGDDDFAYASTSTDNQEDRGERWGTRHEWEAASEDYIRRCVAADTGQYDGIDLEHFEEPPA